MKIKHSIYLLPFCLLAGCVSPGGNQYGESDYVEIKKDPCFGFCPVYSMRINGNGNVVFNGIRNISKEGIWHRTLTSEETNVLFEAFEDAGFWELEDEYTAQVTDLPTTWTTMVVGEKSKTIKDYFGAPESLKELEAKLEAIADLEDGWSKSVNGD